MSYCSYLFHQPIIAWIANKGSARGWSLVIISYRLPHPSRHSFCFATSGISGLKFQAGKLGKWLTKQIRPIYPAQKAG